MVTKAKTKAELKKVLNFLLCKKAGAIRRANKNGWKADSPKK